MAERTGMEAVASKSARRKPVFTRRKADAEAEDASASVPPPQNKAAPMLECPKCGAELADTPKNRAYVGQASMMDEEETEDTDDEYEDDD